MRGRKPIEPTAKRQKEIYTRLKNGIEDKVPEHKWFEYIEYLIRKFN